MLLYSNGCIYYLQQGGYVMPGVCLSVCPSVSVCLIATSRKNYLPELHENVIIDVSFDKEVPTEFWKSSRSGRLGRGVHSPSALVINIFPFR